MTSFAGIADFDLASLVGHARRAVAVQVLATMSLGGATGQERSKAVPTLTFRTTGGGTEIPDYLVERYPVEMAVVLEHQYSDLQVTAHDFAVTLTFAGKPERLRVPHVNLTGLNDKPAKVGLLFPPLAAETQAAGAEVLRRALDRLGAPKQWLGRSYADLQACALKALLPDMVFCLDPSAPQPSGPVEIAFDVHHPDVRLPGFLRGADAALMAVTLERLGEDFRAVESGLELDLEGPDGADLIYIPYDAIGALRSPDDEVKADLALSAPVPNPGWIAPVRPRRPLFDRYIANAGHCIHKLKAKDTTQRWAYYFVYVPQSRDREFLNAIEGDGTIDLEDYGRVVASCYNESPTFELKAYLLERYGFVV